MKLRIAACLLASIAFSFSTANAAGVRGKDSNTSKQQRRVLQGNTPAKYLVQDIQYEHDESGRRLNLFQNLPEKLDTVELEDGLIYTVAGGFVPPGWTVSGQDIFLPPSTIIDDATATITLPNSGSDRLLEGDAYVPEVESTITEDQERNLSELRRQMAVVTGQKTVLAVKIVVSDGAYGFDPSYLECKVFGTTNGSESNCNDSYHLTNGYSECSYGKLTLTKAAARTGSGNVSSISNGVVTVTLPTTSTTAGDGTVRNAVTSALNSAFGSATSLADHLMYCLPPNTMNGIAYAYINSWNSVYSNNWCNNVSVQLHEIGHNLNLAHSNEGTQTYADQSGMMGYSYNNESTPRMCFNAAKNFQLGWYSDKTITVTPSAATIEEACFAGDLYGTAFYGDGAAQTVGIKVNDSGSSTDVYIMFNAKTGIQSGTVEGGNQVMVVTAPGEGTSYGESKLVQKITTNTAGYLLPGFSNTVLYVDSNTPNSHASIRIETGSLCGGPTPNPTTAPPTNVPTPQPTGTPTLPQPTSSPTTAAPTNPPTPSPTVNCGGIFVKSDCNNNAACVWNGNPKTGFCASTTGSPPSPSPPPPSPPTGCPFCASTGQECCGTCIDSGKPSSRGCF
mmetsp:Transcript_23984/g.47645  ORF Transcript_23984/g.47645 Transcript_23984/m.47645 type:complete len:619 (-) Transcript_23984:88-1944(-)